MTSAYSMVRNVNIIMKATYNILLFNKYNIVVNMTRSRDG